MLVAMTNQETEVLSIVVQLNDCQLSFEPPLNPLTSQLSLGEILVEWIHSFVHRGDLIDLLGDEKTAQFSQIIEQDPLIVELHDKTTLLIEEACDESLKLFEAFAQYEFLYQLPVNQSFQLFLSGDKRIKSSTPKNFLNEQDAGRRSAEKHIVCLPTTKRETKSISQVQFRFPLGKSDLSLFSFVCSIPNERLTCRSDLSRKITEALQLN